MPCVRPGMKKPPPGYNVIREKMDEFDDEMRLAIQEESKGVVGRTAREAPARKERATKRPREEETSEMKDAKMTNDIAGAAVARAVGASNSTTAQAEEHRDEKEDEEPVPPLWKVAHINKVRTRYVFDACFRHKTISKEVYDYCCEMQFIDAGLARRWRLPGYEKLCCTACCVPGSASVAAHLTSKYALRDRKEPKDRVVSAGADTATCICRVPAVQRRNKKFLACAVCGCKGCCSSDAAAAKE